MPTERSAALRSAHVGERWVLRLRRTDGGARDRTGWFTAVGAERLRLVDVDGQEHDVPIADVILARRAPAARGGPHPRRIPAEEVEAHARLGWVVETAPLGDWLLRAGGGFTGRANSAHAVGDPGLPVAEAAARVLAYAAEHGIAPMASVLPRTEADAGLRLLGWVDTYVPTEVLAVRLVDLLGSTVPAPGVEVRERLDEDWFAAYGRSRPNDGDPGLVRRLLSGSGPAAFAAIADPDDDAALIGIARAHRHQDWLGVAAVWVDPAHRRRGRATSMLLALGHWAARRGARYAYLQVDSANQAAISAYERLGFERHHRYGYLRPS